MRVATLAMASLAVILLATGGPVGPALAKGKVKAPKEKVSDLSLTNCFAISDEHGEPATLFARFRRGVWEETSSYFEGACGVRYGYRPSPERIDVDSFAEIAIHPLGDRSFEDFVNEYIGTVEGKGSSAKISKYGALSAEIERTQDATWVLLPTAPKSFSPLKRLGALISYCQFTSSYTTKGLVKTATVILIPTSAEAVVMRVEDFPGNRTVSELTGGLWIDPGAVPDDRECVLKYSFQTDGGAHYETVNGVLPKDLAMQRIWKREEYEVGTVGVWVSVDEESKETIRRLALRSIEAPGQLTLEQFASNRIQALAMDFPEQIEQKAGRKVFPHMRGQWCRMTVAPGGDDAAGPETPQPILYKVFTQVPDHKDVKARFIHEWTLEILDPETEEKTVKALESFLKGLHGWVRER